MRGEDLRIVAHPARPEVQRPLALALRGHQRLPMLASTQTGEFGIPFLPHPADVLGGIGKLTVSGPQLLLEERETRTVSFIHTPMHTNFLHQFSSR